MFPFPFSFIGSAIVPDVPVGQIANNHSMRLDGASSGRIDISSVISSISSSSTGSISFWIKPESSSLGDFHETISFASNILDRRYLVFYKSNTEKAYLQYKEGTTSKFILETNSAVFSANTWAHVVITQNGTEPEIYINGSKPAQTFLSSNDKTYWWYNIPSFNTANINAMLWKSGSTLQESFGPGVINVDEVALFNTALPASKIQEIYDATAVVDGVPQTANLFTGGLSSSLVYWNRMGDS